MKKSLISLAVLQASAALAAATTNSNLALAATAQMMKRDLKAGNDEYFRPQSENDDALYLKPIVTKEMLAGTQPMLGDRKPVHIQDDKKPRYDKRPIHIGGGCSDFA